MTRKYLSASADTRVTFVCADRSSQRKWDSLEAVREPIVTVDNPFHALQLLADQGSRYGWEVSRVIIDQDVAELGFLEFLAQVPHTFRGDILFLATPRRAFLSAVGRQDDRVLYALTAPDVDFYLSTTLLSASAPQEKLTATQLSVAC